MTLGSPGPSPGSSRSRPTPTRRWPARRCRRSWSAGGCPPPPTRSCWPRSAPGNCTRRPARWSSWPGVAFPSPSRAAGLAFVPPGPHNDYSDGGWLTPAGYGRLFAGSHYAFKYHAAVVTVRPGANLTAVATRLSNDAARAGTPQMKFGPLEPVEELTIIRDLEALPVALAAFLAVRAGAALGYAVTAAGIRRRRDLAVLQALGLTRRQTRLAVATP